MFFRWFEHHQVYHPYRHMAADGSALGRPWEDLTLRTADGVSLKAWFFPAPADSPRRHWAVLFCHGNGGNIAHRLDYYAILLELGVNVLAFDYRGYGASEGRPSEEGTYLDAQAALDWLGGRGFEASRCIAYGESLGGAVAARLAIDNPLGGLILQSAFTSIPDIGAELFPWLPVRWMASIRYDTREMLGRVRAPVLILHSRQDSLVRFTHATRNFEAAREPKTLWEIPGDHNDGPDADPARYREGMEQFLKQVESSVGSR